MFFGVPNEKDAEGTGAYDHNGIVQEATRKAKSMYSDLLIVADTCLCEYTDHGHCGVINEHTHDVDNDESLPLLVKTAISQVSSQNNISIQTGMSTQYQLLACYDPAIFDISMVRIKSVLPNPKWKDDKEKIVLASSWFLNLSWYYLQVWNKKTLLSWDIINTSEIVWNLWMKKIIKLFLNSIFLI